MLLLKIGNKAWHLCCSRSPSGSGSGSSNNENNNNDYNNNDHKLRKAYLSND